MKVKCIKNEDQEYCLTIGKTYEVSYIFPDGDYTIINDKGEKLWYDKNRFTVT